MKLKPAKQQWIAIVVMILTALLISFGLTLLPSTSTSDIPEPAGIYHKPVCEDGTGGWFTFQIPVEWDGLVEISAVPDENGAYRTSVYSIKDKAEGGGLLFYFSFYPEGSDLTILPMDELGIVETPDGTRYHFVFCRPSDMQFAIDNVENYLAMQEQGAQIAQTPEFQEGYLFTPVAECGMP